MSTSSSKERSSAEDQTTAEASDFRQPYWRAHPVITSVMLVCTLGGAVAGYAVLSGDWSATRRILGGAVSGFGVGLLITGTRMIG